MQIDIHRFDVSPQVLLNQRPVVMLKRELIANDGVRRMVPSAAKLTTSDSWLILQHRLPGEADSRWSIDRSSPQVRVPLFDYLLTDDSCETLVHFGLQTGALAAALIPRDAVVRKLFIALGNVYSRPDAAPGYQVWLGYAVCLEKE